MFLLTELNSPLFRDLRLNSLSAKLGVIYGQKLSYISVLVLWLVPGFQASLTHSLLVYKMKIFNKGTHLTGLLGSSK